MRESQNPWRRIYPAATNALILQVEGRRAEAEPPIRNNLEIYRREIGDKEALVWSHGREAECYDLCTQAELAHNLIQQGRLLEAEVILRDAIAGALKSQGRDSKVTAVLTTAFSELLLERGRPSETASLLNQVISIYDRLNTPRDSRRRAAAQYLLAASEMLQGD